MKGRPAESTAGVGSIGLLIAVVLGVDDPNLIAVLGAAVGLLPAAVTLLVAGGGIRGVLSSLWRGKGAQSGLTLVEVLVVLLIVLVVLILVGYVR
jgi:prepilin-type N-terminal cleavage/methylation domain-containing protein